MVWSKKKKKKFDYEEEVLKAKYATVQSALEEISAMEVKSKDGVDYEATVNAIRMRADIALGFVKNWESDLEVLPPPVPPVRQSNRQYRR